MDDILVLRRDEHGTLLEIRDNHGNRAVPADAVVYCACGKVVPERLVIPPSSTSYRVISFEADPTAATFAKGQFQEMVLRLVGEPSPLQVACSKMPDLSST